MPPLAAVVVEAGVVGVEAVEAGLASYRAYRVAQAAYRLARAAQAAKTLAAAAEKACATCAKIIKCFKKPEKTTDKEFERQLKDQEDAINKMSPDDVLKNINRYREFGRSAGDAAARSQVRNDELASRTESLRDSYIGAGMDPMDARTQSAIDAQSSMAGQDVLHTPDLRAGGDGATSGLGDSSANRSIGRQWNDGRADELEQEAKDAKQRGDEKMNVGLKKC